MKQKEIIYWIMVTLGILALISMGYLILQTLGVF